MSIIAMTREMGSLGKDVAEGLARDLGLRLHYHEIIDSVAGKTHLAPNVITRFLQGKAVNTFKRGRRARRRVFATRWVASYAAMTA